MRLKCARSRRETLQPPPAAQATAINLFAPIREDLKLPIKLP
jgi:hypothetical protein